MKKLAIIGASSFQNPLILRAKEMGIETHVFAWKSGDIGETTADYFYPISIVEKEKIAELCRSIGIDGIASIGSDLANITVAYVAENLNLVSNSVECVFRSTNKHAMRTAFEQGGDPSPASYLVDAGSDYSDMALRYPIIVKPVDRSGSRGITKLAEPGGLHEAIANAASESFSNQVVVEEFAEGNEFSVESLTWNGEHAILAITRKYTTGSPHFIETGHVQPSGLSEEEENAIATVVKHALNTLGVKYGASHSEIKMDADGRIVIIEIGSRMGGDCIGSHLVELSTGYDFVGNVIRVALGTKPEPFVRGAQGAAAIRFIFSEEDIRVLERLEAAGFLAEKNIDSCEGEITDSSSRHGYYIFSSRDMHDIEPYLA